MNQTDKLFYLVKALTPAEKRFFSLYIRRHKPGGHDNRSSTLFSLINDRDDYNETAVKQHLARHGFTGDFPSLKTELYRQILRAMREFRSDKGVSIRLRELLDDAQFLREKGLYDQSGDLLKRAAALATEHDEHWALVRVLDMQRALAYDNTRQQLPQRIEAINEKQSAVLRAIDNLYRMQHLYDRVFVQMRVSNTPTPEVMRTLERVVADPLLRSVRSAITFDARCYFYNTHAHYNTLAGRRDRAFSYQEKLIAHWERSPGRIAGEPQRYMKVLSNFAGLCLALKRHDAFRTTLAKLETIPLRTFDDEAENFQNTTHLRLLSLIHSGRFESVSELLPAIQDGMERYARRINPARRLALYYNLAVLTFCVGKFTESLYWLNRIIDDRRAGVRQDILISAHLLCPVAHFELGHDEFIETLLRRVRRYLQSSGGAQLQAFETELLRFLRRLPTTPAPVERLALFRTMSARVEQLLQDGPARLGLHEIACWIESRITGRRLPDVCRDRMRRK